MKRKITLCLLSLLLVITVPMAAAAKNKEDGGPVGRPSVSQVPVETPKPKVTPIPVATPTPSPSPSPRPASTPSSGVSVSTPTPTQPTPTPQPAFSPSATPAPIATPAPGSVSAPTTAPSVEPEATPTPTQGALNIDCEADNGVVEGFTLEVAGHTQDGSEYSRDFRSDEAGKITTTIPPGSYTAAPKDSSNTNRGYDLPGEQKFSIIAGGSIYLNFYFTANQRTIVLTVLDDDDTPLEDVTIGIYPVEEEEVPEEEVPIKDTTDITKQMEESALAAEEAERQANPYDRDNALATGKTDAEGKVTIEDVPVTSLLAVAIDVPDGYTLEEIPSEIPSGLETGFELLCEYLKVDLEIVNEKTSIPVVDAEAVLYDTDGAELTNWLTEGRPHRLIRVPAGEYTLDLHYNDQIQSVTFEVTSDTTVQEVNLETYLTGSIALEEPEESPINVLEIILVLVLLAAVVGLIVGGVFFYKQYRRRSGGYQ